MSDWLEYLDFNVGEHCPPIVCPACFGRDMIPLVVRTRDGVRPTKQQLQDLADALPCQLCQGLGVITARQYGWWVLGEKLKRWRIVVAKTGPRQAAEAWGMNPISDLFCIENGQMDPSRHPRWQEALVTWSEVEQLSQLFISYDDQSNPA